MKYKKEIVKIISELAPEFLTTKNLGKLVEKLYSVGIVKPEEKMYFEIRLQAKIICLMIEKVFEEHGCDANVCLMLVDRENDTKHGKVVILSAPHFPEELVELWDGLEITPFSGVSCRSVVLNKVVEAENLETSLLYDDETNDLIKKYGLKSNISFPIHYDDGEVIGALVINCRNVMRLKDEHKKCINSKIEALEHFFTRIQEEWRHKDVIGFKAILSEDFTVVYVEPMVEDFIGYKPEEINHQCQLESFIHPDDKELVISDLEPLIKEKRTSRTVYRCRCKEGGYVTMEKLFIPIKNPDGTLRYIETHISVNSAACREFDRMLQQRETATS